MKTQLIRGELPTPTSLRSALARRQQLQHEIVKVENQINNPTRITQYPTTSEYDQWRNRAGHALKLFKLEEQQLIHWIAENGRSNETLLEEAYRVLQNLELEVDFEPKEAAFMEQLDRHFGKVERKTA